MVTSILKPFEIGKQAMRQIWVIYRKPLGKTERVLQVVGQCGSYTHCELYCPDYRHCGLVGWTFTNFSFCRMLCTRECIPSYCLEREKYMYHVVSLDNAQFERFIKWNNNQVQHKCKYNYSDVCRQILPHFIAKSITSEVDMNRDFHNRLFCSQAVLLSLRASLHEDHPIIKCLACLTSRLTTPSILCDQLSLCLGAPLQMPLVKC